MKLRILTWIHDHTGRVRFWPVAGLVRAYAIGYVEGVRFGPEAIPGLFGAWDRRRKCTRIGKTRASRAYSRGNRAGSAVRGERKRQLRVVA